MPGIQGIWSQEDYDAWLRDIKKIINGGKEISFGTNESFYYDSIDEFLDDVDVFHLSDEEAKVIEKFFPGSQYGTGGAFDIDLDCYDWDDEDLDLY